MSPASLALGLLLLAGPASAATVLSVGDGDTLRVVEGSQRLTIRLACIDAPVAAQNPYGAAARQHQHFGGVFFSIEASRSEVVHSF